MKKSSYWERVIEKALNDADIGVPSTERFNELVSSISTAFDNMTPDEMEAIMSDERSDAPDVTEPPYRRSTVEEEQAVDEVLGLVRLLPIKLHKTVYDQLVVLANVKGIIAQALARKLLIDEIETWTEVRLWANRDHFAFLRDEAGQKTQPVRKKKRVVRNKE